MPFSEQFDILFNKREIDKNNKKNFYGNEGNFNHFCNVVACMAHVIHYAEKHIHELLPEDEQFVERTFSEERKLDLMFSAYYHDIGKTIVDRRHAMEGKSLFSEPKAFIKYRFSEIAKRYDDYDLSSWKLTIFSENIGAHDALGTVSTGENGLLCMRSIIGRFRSLYNWDKEKTATAVFDLWLLTIADLITAFKFISDVGYDRGKPQPWRDFAPGNLKGKDKKIDELLKLYKWKYLIEDLHFSLQIVRADDIRKESRILSEQRAAHRLGRLTRQTLGSVLEVVVLEKNNKFPIALKDKLIKKLEEDALITDIKDILRRDFGADYEKYFGVMQQFDYSLGFFEKLAKRAIMWLENELVNNSFRTGWIYSHHSLPQNFIDDYNADCIVKNFLVIIAGIFGEIHRLTDDVENWNIEFGDATERLGDISNPHMGSKADELLYFEGTYRAGNTRAALMKEIMLYKS